MDEWLQRVLSDGSDGLVEVTTSATQSKTHPSSHEVARSEKGLSFEADKGAIATGHSALHGAPSSPFTEPLKPQKDVPCKEHDSSDALRMEMAEVQGGSVLSQLPAPTKNPETQESPLQTKSAGNTHLGHPKSSHNPNLNGISARAQDSKTMKISDMSCDEDVTRQAIIISLLLILNPL